MLLFVGVGGGDGSLFVEEQGMFYKWSEAIAYECKLGVKMSPMLINATVISVVILIR